MEELFDRASDSDVKPHSKKPQQQQAHQQQTQRGESSQQGCMECNVQQSISKPAEAPKPDKSKSDKDDTWKPTPWVFTGTLPCLEVE